MVQDIYDPLNEYIKVFRDRFKTVAEQTFEELAKEADVDVESNHKTCTELYAAERSLESIKNKIGGMTFLCVLLWILLVLGLVLCILYFKDLQTKYLAIISCLALVCLVLNLKLVHPRLKKLKEAKEELNDKIQKLRDEAWSQMEPLNSLYDWDVLTRMMSKTVPRLEFDPYFTTQRLADLKNCYAWDDSFNASRSVIYSLSGLINGNPFVICRTRKMEMGQKTYYGSKTIYWTTREIGSDGKPHTVSHSETLTASVTAPYPEYFEKTRLIYGNTAAPDLIFYRKQNDLAGREGSLSYKWKKHQLKRKARNLSNADFAMMTNEDFEVAFNTSNRNNNQQYALLFTPLAQENMLNLLKDEESGFGDDFDFDKNKMINTIIADHMQDLVLDMNPDQYKHFDFDIAKERFFTINSRYFRAIYFCLAPLLCVPMYQQIRPLHDIYGMDMRRQSAFWEHEALANFWGQSKFKASDCVSDCILKTKLGKDESTVEVSAHGYRSEQRVSYISRWGGDGRMHQVPVHWEEFFPVTGYGQFRIREDNELEESANISARERLEHISKVLADSKLDIYRRHIASKL